MLTMSVLKRSPGCRGDSWELSGVMVTELPAVVTEGSGNAESKADTPVSQTMKNNVPSVITHTQGEWWGGGRGIGGGPALDSTEEEIDTLSDIPINEDIASQGVPVRLTLQQVDITTG